jgi:stage II sporulation protein AA (anti-sigma F factor antagonist)
LEKFAVESKTLPDAAVVYPKGYLNNIVGEKLEKECAAHIEKGIRKIVLDFGRLEFINSIGISLLLSIIEKLRRSKGILCFSNIRKPHLDVFEMLGLTKYVLIFDTEADALKHLQAGTTA